jgi:branched-chain amino acid transport system ATP-binding protein
VTEPVATEPVLVTEGLVSGYGRRPVLHGVDLAAPPAAVTVVIGPNGSGKSTLVKTVAGLVRTWRGSTRLAGQEIAGQPAHALVRRGVCLVPQGRVVFPFLTVEENLRTFGFPVRSERELRRRTAEAYDFLPLLAQRRRQLATTLSGGEQAMLSLAKVIMLRPTLLLLDEPSLGLSPKVTDLVYRKVAELTAGGLTTVIVEQNVHRALEVAGHVLVLVLGRARYQGDPARLAREVDLGRLFVEGKG